MINGGGGVLVNGNGPDSTFGMGGGETVCQRSGLATLKKEANLIITHFGTAKLNHICNQKFPINKHSLFSHSSGIFPVFCLSHLYFLT